MSRQPSGQIVARVFDGNTSNRMRSGLGASARLPGPAVYTVACWFNTTTVAAGQGMLWGRDCSATANRHMQFRRDGSSVELVSFNTAGGAATGSKSGIVVDRWFHAAGTIDANQDTIGYLNGVAGTPDTLSGTATGYPASTADDTPDAIGYRMTSDTADTPANPFSGAIASPCMWNTVLSSSEISALARGAPPWQIRPQNIERLYLFTTVANEWEYKTNIPLNEIGTVSAQAFYRHAQLRTRIYFIPGAAAAATDPTGTFAEGFTMGASFTGEVGREGTFAEGFTMGSAMNGLVGREGTISAGMSFDSELNGDVAGVTNGTFAAGMTFDSEMNGLVVREGTFAEGFALGADFRGLNNTGTFAEGFTMGSALSGLVGREGTFAEGFTMGSALSGLVGREGTISAGMSMDSSLGGSVPAPTWTVSGGDATHNVTDGPRIAAALLDYNNAIDNTDIKEAGRFGDSGASNNMSAFLTRTPAGTDKVYIEWTRGNAANSAQCGTGIVNSSFVNANENPGVDLHEWGIRANGEIHNNNSLLVDYSGSVTDTNGDVWGLAFDVATGNAWVRYNGSWLGNDPTGAASFTVTGSSLEFVCKANGNGEIRWNFGQRAFANAAPAGYSGLGDYP